MSISLDKPILCPIIVGRSSYLDVLRQRLDEAHNGHGQTLLLAGEAGIGKSRLVAEAREWAHQNSLIVLQGNCFEPDRILPYAPLLDLLRKFIGAHSVTPLEPFAPELIKLLPELGAVLPNVVASSPLEPAQEKQRYFQTLDRCIDVGSAGSLVVIEDIHWCDDTSLEYLLHFAHRISDTPTLLLLTYRNDELHPSLSHFLADMDHAHLASEMTLKRLSREDVGAMMTAIFDQVSPIRSEFVEAMHSLTDGNPFFVEETLKALMASGDIYYSLGGWTRKPLDELHIPRTVQDAVARRIDRLSVEARELLNLAAVAGRRFDFDLLQRLTRSTETDLLKWIRELVAAQLVIEESADHFLFRHALTGQAIYSHLLGRERRNLHCSVATALEERLGESIDPNLLAGSLSYHCFEAGLWQKAFHYAREAAERAQALYTPRAAVEHLNRAIIAAQHLSAGLPVELYRARGHQYETLGDFDAAQNDFQTALDEARARGDHYSEWQALIDLGFLWTARDYIRTGDYFQQALALVHHLDDSAALAQNLNRVGNWHLNIDQAREAVRYHHEALRIFEKLDDKRGLASTHDLLGITYYSSNDIHQGIAHYEQAIALFRQLGDRGGLASSLVIFASRGCEYIGSTAVPMRVSLEQRLQALREAQEIARETDSKPAQALTAIWLGMNLNVSGDYGGFAYLREGLARAETIDHQHFCAVALMILGISYLDVLAPALAREPLQRALDLAHATNSTIWLGMLNAHLALTHLRLNDMLRAQSTLEMVLHPNTSMDTMGNCQLWAAQAELLLAQGRADKALETIEALIAALPNIEKDGEYSNPRLGRLRGEILIALRRYAAAEKVLHGALDSAQTLELKPQAWRVWASLGRLYRAQGRPELFDEASRMSTRLVGELADSLADTDLRENFRVRAAAEWKGKATLSRHELDKRQFDGLTPRERGIAALIAQGRSNKEIAEALVLSNRTVEAHIGNILSKLNFSSRAQIAVWAVEKSLSKI
jgi:tetratricopeptide (TPR) repeat protein